jgi:hypothetical protein
MKVSFFTYPHLLNLAKFFYKTLAIFILSILLIAPAPAWALDYGTLQSYVSKVNIELDGVVTSIQKLPSLSYENGQTTLVEIDNKLEKVKNDANKDATNFQKISDQLQQEYQKNLDAISKDQVLSKYAQQMESDFKKPHWGDPLKTPGLSVGETELLYEESKKYCKNQGVNTDKDTTWIGFNKPFPSCIKDYLTSVRKLDTYTKTISADQYVIKYLYFFFPNEGQGAVKTVYERSVQENLLSYSEIKQLYTRAKQYCEGRGITMSSNGFPNCADTYFRSISQQVSTSVADKLSYYIIPETRSQAFETQSLINNVRALYYIINVANLQNANKQLANSITLTNKISKLCDSLEKRINLATQKFGNVKEYSDALKSFSDPDVLGEIKELNSFLEDLTNNLTFAN